MNYGWGAFVFFVVSGILVCTIVVSQGYGWVLAAEAERLEYCAYRRAGYDTQRGLHWKLDTSLRRYWQKLQKPSSLHCSIGHESLVALEQRFVLLAGGLVRAQAMAMQQAFGRRNWTARPPLAQSEQSRLHSYLSSVPARTSQPAGYLGAHLPVLDRHGDLLAFDELQWTFASKNYQNSPKPRYPLAMLASEADVQADNPAASLASLYASNGSRKARKIESGFKVGLNVWNLDTRLYQLTSKNEAPRNPEDLFASMAGDPAVGRKRRWPTGACSLPVLGVTHHWRTDHRNMPPHRLEHYAATMSKRTSENGRPYLPDTWFRKPLQTTLDWQLQCSIYYQMQSLSRARIADFGDRGLTAYAIVAEVDSGEILSMAEYPSMDYNFAVPSNPVADIPLSLKLSLPASTFKPFLVAWMLEAQMGLQPRAGGSSCNADLSRLQLRQVLVDETTRQAIESKVEDLKVPEQNIGADGELIDMEATLKKSNQLAIAQHLLDLLDLINDKDAVWREFDKCMQSVFEASAMQHDALVGAEKRLFAARNQIRRGGAFYPGGSKLWQHLRIGWGQGGIAVSALQLVQAYRVLAISAFADSPSIPAASCDYSQGLQPDRTAPGKSRQLAYLHLTKPTSTLKTLLYSPAAARQVWQWLCYSNATPLGAGTGAAACIGRRSWAVKTGTPVYGTDNSNEDYLMIGGVPAHNPRFIVAAGVLGLNSKGDIEADRLGSSEAQLIRRLLWSHAAWEVLTRYGKSQDMVPEQVRSECL